MSHGKDGTERTLECGRENNAPSNLMLKRIGASLEEDEDGEEEGSVGWE
jgi:hypothetical protein